MKRVHRKRRSSAGGNTMLRNFRIIYYFFLFISIASFFYAGRSLYQKFITPVENFDAEISVISRSEWGADESLLFAENEPQIPARTDQIYREYPNDLKVERTVTTVDGNFLKSVKQFTDAPKRIAIHHTAGEESPSTRREVEEYLQRLLALHTNKEGGKYTGDLPYHYFVDKEGNVYEGIRGGDAVIGTHIAGGNTGTLGIAVIGNYDEEILSSQTKEALKKLVREKVDEYEIDPRKQVSFIGNTIHPIAGHMEFREFRFGDAGNITNCPGENIIEIIPEIRSFTEETLTEREGRDQNTMLYGGIFVVSCAVVLFLKEQIVQMKEGKKKR